MAIKCLDRHGHICFNKRMSMRLNLLRIGVVAVSCAFSLPLAYADSWAPAKERDFTSNNGTFVVHLIPGIGESNASIQVSQAREAERIKLWECTLVNSYAPLQVLVSDDGKYVITLDTHGRAGYGDEVVAFYNADGPIKHYSLEEVLLNEPAPDDFAERFHLGKQFRNRFSHSTSSRWWHENDIKLFDEIGSRSLFCLWLPWDNRWIAWWLDNGVPIEVTDEMTDSWHNKTRKWALDHVKPNHEINVQRTRYNKAYTAYLFLGYLGRPEDRPLIERILEAPDFRVSNVTHNDSSYFLVYSDIRQLADHVLANWDGPPESRALPRWSGDIEEHALGSIVFEVVLPEKPSKSEGGVWLFLLPSDWDTPRWRNADIKHRAVIRGSWFDSHYEMGNELSVHFTNVLPGKYRLLVSWDKAEPFADTDQWMGSSSHGDYESKPSEIIEVKASEIVEIGAIKCNQDPLLLQNN